MSNQNRRNTQSSAPTVNPVEVPEVEADSLLDGEHLVVITSDAVKVVAPAIDPKYIITPGKTITLNVMGVDVTIEPKNPDGTVNPQYTKTLKTLEEGMDLALADDRFKLEDMLKARISTMLDDIQETWDIEHGEGVKDVKLLLANWAIGVWFGSKGIDHVEFSEGKKLESRKRALRSDAGTTHS